MSAIHPSQLQKRKPFIQTATHGKTVEPQGTPAVFPPYMHTSSPLSHLPNCACGKCGLCLERKARYTQSIKWHYVDTQGVERCSFHGMPTNGTIIFRPSNKSQPLNCYFPMKMPCGDHPQPPKP